MGAPPISAHPLYIGAHRNICSATFPSKLEPASGNPETSDGKTDSDSNSDVRKIKARNGFAGIVAGTGVSVSQCKGGAPK